MEEIVSKIVFKQGSCWLVYGSKLSIRKDNPTQKLPYMSLNTQLSSYKEHLQKVK